jgi:hypothetical protein
VYEKQNMIFSFETLGRMHKNIFFSIFQVFLYFGSFDENQEFEYRICIFFSIKIPTKY